MSDKVRRHWHRWAQSVVWSDALHRNVDLRFEHCLIPGCPLIRGDAAEMSRASRDAIAEAGRLIPA